MLPGMSRAAVTPKGRVLRHPGDLQWLERRRLQAADLFAQGKTRAEVAGELGVSAQTASRWYARWRDGGAAGMRTARQGKPAQLGSAELARVRRVLDRGAVAAGFDRDLWTLGRVAEVIERVTGVGHHPGHVWRILKRRRWSLQRPARKAVERNEAEIAGGLPRSGRGSSKRPNAQSLALLHRRIGRQRVPTLIGPEPTRGVTQVDTWGTSAQGQGHAHKARARAAPGGPHQVAGGLA
jgi:transposase